MLSLRLIPRTHSLVAERSRVRAGRTIVGNIHHLAECYSFPIPQIFPIILPKDLDVSAENRLDLFLCLPEALI